MSVSAFPAVPQTAPGPTSPPLHLVPAHDHVWELRSVDYDDGLEVRRYECCTCDDVLFR